MVKNVSEAFNWKLKRTSSITEDNTYSNGDIQSSKEIDAILSVQLLQDSEVAELRRDSANELIRLQTPERRIEDERLRIPSDSK